MKRFTIRVFFSLLIAISPILVSAQVACDVFCVTGIQLDTANPEYMLVSIHFAGDEKDFINYPHVKLVTNLQGDTLGTGTLNFFGQTGNSSQDYEVLTTLTTIPDNFEAIIHFYFDTVSCILSYPCTTNAVNLPELDSNFFITPNPIYNEALLQFSQDLQVATLAVYNASGRPVDKISQLNGRSYLYNTEQLLSGIYYFIIRQDNAQSVQKAIILK